jgi:hypothetical protein
MPPPRARPPPDDSRSEASSSTREKAAPVVSNATNLKGRRVPNSVAIGSSLRDVITAGQPGPQAGGSGTASSEGNPGVL